MNDATTRPWATTNPGRLIGHGHPAGDILEAWAWEVLDRSDGYLSISAHLPTHLCNPRGELFGGFTPTYVDLLAIQTVRSHQLAPPGQPPRLSTISLRVDYLEPITGPTFIIDSHLERQRGRTNYVTTRFMQAGDLAALAATVIIETAPDGAKPKSDSPG